MTFNFRGVEKSSGRMGDGTEEQNDLLAICNYAQNQLKYSQIFIIGYSYGGLISLSTARKLKKIVGMTLISYPMGFTEHLTPDYDVNFPILFIHGEHDDVIPQLRVQQSLPSFKNRTKFVSVTTDHFYNGREKEVGIIIGEFLSQVG